MRQVTRVGACGDCRAPLHSEQILHMTPNLDQPIWTIDHVSAALHVSVDTAREYTYRTDFPRPKAPFHAHLWCREAVLAWFRSLPDKPQTERRQALPTPAPSGADVPQGTPPARTQPAGKYKPRRR